MTGYARAVLWLSALAWVGFGVWLFWLPGEMAGAGLDPNGAMGRIEIRGFYGGLELGIGAWTGWCALAEERYRAGLLFTALSLGGLATGRLLGCVLDGEFPGLMLGLMAIEYSAAVAAVIALRTTARA